MTETDPVLRVVVADDQRSVREALGTLLDVSPGFEVAGLAADGEEAVAMAAELRPDVVLMDLRMPRCDGTEATRRIMTELPGVRVVVLTTFADDASILSALEAGASGYLTKDAGREQIALAVRSAAAGQTVLDPAVQATLLASATRAGGAPSRTGPATAGSAAAPRSPASVTLPDGMTEREGDVLRLVAGGRTNAEIAAELFVAEATVKTHINNLFAKTHVRSRAEAVQYAYRHGLVAPG
jgi:DNA-binding NarL/FixJ family response regulator